jgi:hypothetical protein
MSEEAMRINLRVLQRKVPEVVSVQGVLPFVIQLVYDSVTKLWLASHFQGPLFMARLKDGSLMLVLLSQKKPDHLLLRRADILDYRLAGTEYLHIKRRNPDCQQKISLWAKHDIQRVAEALSS